MAEDPDKETVLVEPRLISGFRDYGPQEMITKNRILQIVATVYERFGFEPLDTATVQLEKILFGEDEFTTMAYFRAWNSRRHEGAQSEKMALRYDLTVSLARYVAEHLEELPRPFKRWQWGKVFRGEKPQQGRFCEFIQCDADIMFAESMLADAEIIALISACMQALGVTRYAIYLNNRKIANGFPEWLGFSAELLPAVLQEIDKLDKITREEVAAALINEVKLSDTQTQRLLDFCQATAGTNAELLWNIAEQMHGVAIAETGVQELLQVLQFAKAMGVPEEVIVVDNALARGLSYYTGPVFECKLLDAPEFGSVFGGGRFDNLVSRFSTAKVPGTGASIGIDRFLAAAIKLGLPCAKPTRSVVKVMVAYQKSEFIPQALEVANVFRQSGINTLVYSGSAMAFKAQFARAVSEEIPFVSILGEAEIAAGKIMLRDMTTRKQILVNVEEAISVLLQ